MISLRSLTVAFFDQWLKEPKDRPFDGLAPLADLYISVYPLEGLQPIPTSERPHRAGFVGGFLRQHMLFDRWVRSGSKVLMETRG